MVLFCELSLAFIVVCAAVYAYLFFRYRYLAREHLKINSPDPSVDDCRWEAKQMMQFVEDRCCKVHNDCFAGCKKGMEDTMYTCKGYDLTELVRLAHQAGCRIIIKKVADHDIENPRTTREYLENHHMKLRRQRDERLNKRYS